MSELIESLRLMAAPSSEAALGALVTAMLDLLRESETHAQRSLAARTLGEIGDTRAVDGLIAALADEHVNVRGTAARALLELATPPAIAAVRGILGDADAHLRRAVLAELVAGEHLVGTHPAPLASFLDDRDPSVRQQAVLALQQTGHVDAFPLLLHHLHDPDSRVALEVATALGHTANPAAVGPLYAVAADETAYYLLRGAAIASLHTLALAEVNPLLVRLLDDPDVYIRRSAVNALTAVTTPAAVETLLAVADSHRTLVTPVRDALVRCGGQIVEDAMLAALGHLREWVRSLAIEVLGALESAAAVPRLLEVLRHDVPEIQVLAATALGQIGAAAGVPALTAALDDESWLVEMAAASALRRVATPEALAALAAWRASRDEHV
jgi:HEAT repeat protein